MLVELAAHGSNPDFAARTGRAAQTASGCRGTHSAAFEFLTFLAFSPKNSGGVACRLEFLQPSNESVEIFTV